MDIFKKESFKYLVSGLSAVATDYLVYLILLNFLSHSLAKAISFISGMFVAFVLNKYWTFSSKNKVHKDIFKFVILYTCSLTANVLSNKLVLIMFPLVITVAFVVATGVSVIMNYVGQKYWVFKIKS